MRQRLDWNWVAVLSFAFVPVGLIGMFFLVLLWPRCDVYEKLLARDTHGRSIVSVLKACGSIGSSMIESIELKSALRRRQMIIKFEPDGGIVACKGQTFPKASEPAADWSTPGNIRISIPLLSSIVEKYDEVEGIHITYAIGPQTSEVCGVGKKSVD
jgi:hypothetical protein